MFNTEAPPFCLLENCDAACTPNGWTEGMEASKLVTTILQGLFGLFCDDDLITWTVQKGSPTLAPLSDSSEVYSRRLSNREETVQGRSGDWQGLPDRSVTPDLRSGAFADAYGVPTMGQKAADPMVPNLTTPRFGEELGMATSTAQTCVKSIPHEIRPLTAPISSEEWCSTRSKPSGTRHLL